MMKITRCKAWGIASVSATTFALVFGSGVLIYLQLLSEETQLGISLLLIMPVSAVIGLLLACGIGEQLLEWWCSKPETIHKHIVGISAAFVSLALIGLLSLAAPPNHER